MKRVVFDANVIISCAIGAHRPNTTVGRILHLWQSNLFVVVTSTPIVEDVTRHLARLELESRTTSRNHDVLLNVLHKHGHVTPVTVVLTGVATHPEDDIVVATAVSAQADCLVTGDKQLMRE